MKSSRYFLRLVSAFFSRHRKVIFVGFVLGILSFLVSPTLLFLILSKKEVKQIGLVGRYTVEDIPGEIQQLISLGLTKIDDSGRPIPGLAEEWKAEDNGKVYTFRLKQNLFWHDKTPIKAADINYNFKDAQIEVLDNEILKFTLKEPFAPFPTIAARPIFKKGLVGAGPYQVKKIARNGQFIDTIYLQANDKNREDIQYRFYPTESAAKTGLKLGEVRILKGITDKSDFENWKNIQQNLQLRFDQYAAIFFNTKKTPFDDKTFRQALAYALTKKVGQERALGPISPYSWAFNEDIKTYDYNPQKAKELLSKAVGTNKDISVTLATSTYLISEAERIAQEWEAIGIKVSLETITAPNEETQILLAIHEIPSDPDQYLFWHSTQQTSNTTHFNKPRIDKLLEDGRKTIDLEKRKKVYYDFQRFLAEEVPAIFLYHPTTYEITRKSASVF